MPICVYLYGHIKYIGGRGGGEGWEGDKNPAEGRFKEERGTGIYMHIYHIYMYIHIYIKRF
jgi:hypothetical protein